MAMFGHSASLRSCATAVLRTSAQPTTHHTGSWWHRSAGTASRALHSLRSASGAQKPVTRVTVWKWTASLPAVRALSTAPSSSPTPLQTLKLLPTKALGLAAAAAAAFGITLAHLATTESPVHADASVGGGAAPQSSTSKASTTSSSASPSKGGRPAPAPRHSTAAADSTDPEERPWDTNWDCMEPPSDAPPRRKRCARYIVLVRHGQYVNADRDEDLVLSALGRTQARIVGQRLEQMKLQLSHVWVSDIVRARETWEIMSKAMPSAAKTPWEFDQLLREGAPCVPEPAHSSWKPGPEEFFREGARIEAAFRKHIHRPPPSQTETTWELLVCHGNVIRYFTMRALQLPANAWLRLSHANCGITILRISSEGNVSLQAFGDSGHLTPEQTTFN